MKMPSTRLLRPIERQKMRPWLENLLNNQIVSGLKWIDRDNKIFEIPWRHGSKHGYSPEKDANLFERWAKHTGRYDVKDSNAKRWKANFRCALNSLDDVKEIMDEKRNKETRCSRIYQFISKSKRENRRPYKRRKLPDLDSVSTEDNSDITSDISECKPMLSTDHIKTEDNVLDCNGNQSYNVMSWLKDCSISESGDSQAAYSLAESIKAENEEIIEIEVPFELGFEESYEVDRGVFQHLMCGFVMFKKTTIPEPPAIDLSDPHLFKIFE